MTLVHKTLNFWAYTSIKVFYLTYMILILVGKANKVFQFFFFYSEVTENNIHKTPAPALRAYRWDVSTDALTPGSARIFAPHSWTSEWTHFCWISAFITHFLKQWDELGQENFRPHVEIESTEMWVSSRLLQIENSLASTFPSAFHFKAQIFDPRSLYLLIDPVSAYFRLLGGRCLSI